MPKAEWGTKRVCPTTGRRFYDLGRTPIISPYTGDVVTLETGRTSRVMVERARRQGAKPSCSRMKTIWSSTTRKRRTSISATTSSTTTTTTTTSRSTISPMSPATTKTSDPAGADFSLAVLQALT